MKIYVLGAKSCPHCNELKKILEEKRIPHIYIDLDQEKNIKESPIPLLAQHKEAFITIPSVIVEKEEGKPELCGEGFEERLECIEHFERELKS